jgi:carbon-monoxide dehydrogenase medium subunit
MKAASFEYLRPKTLAEASAALAQEGVTATAIAGGQSLVPMLSLRVALPELVVDISRLEELKGVSETPAGLTLGALTTHAAIEDGKVPDVTNGLMRRIAAGISYRAVRNHGTIGGSLALADPAADWPACLMALGASVRVAGTKGARSEPIADFVRGIYETSLTAGEIVLGVDIPRPAAPLRWGFVKVARKSGAFASSIAIAAAQGEGGPVSVVLGAAAGRPIRLRRAADLLQAGNAAEDSLRPAIAKDLATQTPDADAYQQRLHTATILRAIREMQAQ